MSEEPVTEESAVLSSILKLLQAGDEEIESPPGDNVILLIGNTGSGKSTVAQFICSSSDNLISVETGPNSGEYIISDDKGRISVNSTIISRTVFPELIVSSSKKDLVLYDCPGFSDTRSVAHDIASTYFTKKVVDMAKKVKIVLVINYPSVRKGVDRLDFILLVKHACKFIKDIDKFKGSIALLVTKVDNQCVKSGGTFKLVSDEVLISMIADFLMEVKLSIQEKGIFEADHLDKLSFHDNASKFIDAILEKGEHSYKRIGIFRRPDEAGKLSQIDLLNTGKKSIENILFENISFVEKCEFDFGYSISADSNNYVYDLSLHLGKCLFDEVELISTKIETHFQKLEEHYSNDIYYLQNKFNSLYNIFRDFIANLTDIDVGIISNFIEKNEDLKIGIFIENFKNIEKYESHLKFLELVSDQARVNRSDCLRAFSGLSDYIQGSKTWYYFLIHLYSLLSEYNVQKDIQMFNVAHLIEQCGIRENSNSAEGLRSLNEVFEFICKYIKHCRSELYLNDLNNAVLNKEKFKALKNVLHLTLCHKALVEHPSADTLVYKREFIILNDIIDKLKEENIKFVEVHAMNKLFIDKDIDKSGSRLQLSLVSPVWEIVGNTKVVLDGCPGEEQDKAKSGKGMPGLPGGPAGNFFGVAGSIVGGSLNLFARGGKGGSGQDGGDGEDAVKGDDGLSPNDTILNDIYEYIFDEDITVRNDFKVRLTKPAGFNWRVFSGCAIEYKCWGKPAKVGSDGGDGGVGGKGGHGGDIKIEDLSKSGKVYLFTEDGEDGRGGLGGKGGQGAPHGNVVIAYTSEERLFGFRLSDLKWKNISQIDVGCSEGGKCGKAGNNYDCQKLPDKRDDLVGCFDILNAYVIWVTENLNRGIGDPKILQFIQNIEGIMQTLYTTIEEEHNETHD